MYDFGTELFDYLNICGAEPEEKLALFYGESKEEALDTNYSYITDRVSGAAEYQLRQRTFRNILICGSNEKLDVSESFEFLPLSKKGTFFCNDELLNQIYKVSADTFHLNC